MLFVPAIQEIEAAAYEAWPAAELVVYDGWELRFAHGFSRRGNSVYPAKPSTIDRGLKLEWCSDWFRERALDLVVRQNPATEPGLEEMLEANGFTREGHTHVMVAEIGAAAGSPPSVANVATEDWWTAAADLWEIGPEQAMGWRAIIERIAHPAGFGLVRESGRPIAVGLAVAVGSWLGLFEIIVAPGHRREGIGRRFTRSLMDWGAARDARRAFLQVVAENDRAIGMYETLGFEFAYPYWYRRAPAKKEVAPTGATPPSISG